MVKKRKRDKPIPGLEKLDLKPVRRIEIYPEADTSAELVPCCYEYQVEMGRTRAFLRTRARYSAIPVRVLEVPGNPSFCPLLSVDDRVWQKQEYQRFRKKLDARSRASDPLRGNLWWLLALSLLLLADFLHVAERATLLAWLTPPYVVTGGLLLSLWAWSRWPESWRRKPSDLNVKVEALGESIPFADNLPGTSFRQPDTRAAQRLALDFAEGQVSQVKYSYSKVYYDADESIVVLNFILIRTDCTTLFCRQEVRKSDALFFVCDGDAVRLLGYVEAGKMAVKHAVNLNDGHVHGDLPLFSSLRSDSSAVLSNRRFFLWVVGQSVAFSGLTMAALLAVCLAGWWWLDLLFDRAFELREMRGQLGIFIAAFMALILAVSVRKSVREAICAQRIAQAFGLLHPNEIVSRQRLVCNQRYYEDFTW